MPNPAPPTPTDAYRFLSASWRIGRALADRLDPLLRDRYDLDRRDYLVLSTIRRGVRHPSEVADTLRMPRDMVSRTLHKLTEAGLVERTPDEADSRRARLALTPRGAERRGEVQKLFEATLEASLGSLGDERRERLLVALDELVAHLDGESRGAR